MPVARFWLLSRIVHNGLHEFWRHTPSGQLWAVHLDGGELAGACGPLDRGEVSPAVLPYLWFHFRDVQWIREHPGDFAREPLDA